MHFRSTVILSALVGAPALAFSSGQTFISHALATRSEISLSARSIAVALLNELQARFEPMSDSLSPRITEEEERWMKEQERRYKKQQEEAWMREQEKMHAQQQQQRPAHGAPRQQLPPPAHQQQFPQYQQFPTHQQLPPHQQAVQQQQQTQGQQQRLMQEEQEKARLRENIWKEQEKFVQEAQLGTGHVPTTGSNKQVMDADARKAVVMRSLQNLSIAQLHERWAKVHSGQHGATRRRTGRQGQL